MSIEYQGHRSRSCSIFGVIFLCA